MLILKNIEQQLIALEIQTIKGMAHSQQKIVFLLCSLKQIKFLGFINEIMLEANFFGKKI